MARLDHLHGLLACLQGQIPADPDWPCIIALANKTLCSPAMAAGLIDGGNFIRLPDDVQVFLQEIITRNGERNRRLMDQLDEAAAVMNAAGVRPVLMKGTMWLAHVMPHRRNARLLADLDLMVPGEHFFAVIDELSGIGYSLDSPPDRTDVPVVLSRKQDAATIDLHTEYGSAAALFCSYDDLAGNARVVDLSSGTVLLPSAASSIAVLLLHDQLKGRDYLRGRIDLRHLLDIQGFAEKLGDRGWAELEALFTRPYARQAMRTQLLTASKLLRMKVPRQLVRGVRARLQYCRRLIQLRWPRSAPALTLLSMLDPAYLGARRAFRRSEPWLAPDERGRLLPRRRSVERLLIRNELGKI